MVNLFSFWGLRRRRSGPSSPVASRFHCVPGARVFGQLWNQIRDNPSGPEHRVFGQLWNRIRKNPAPWGRPTLAEQFSVGVNQKTTPSPGTTESPRAPLQRCVDCIASNRFQRKKNSFRIQGIALTMPSSKSFAPLGARHPVGPFPALARNPSLVRVSRQPPAPLPLPMAARRSAPRLAGPAPNAPSEPQRRESPAG
jgi:hypothetical protein